MSIYKKLLEVQKEVGAISKDSKNPFFKSKYFDINQLIEHVQPVLNDKGLVLIQPLFEDTVRSIIVDSETGEKIESGLSLPQLTDPQKLGSCITYYRRYTLASLLGLQAEDDDGNNASKQNKPKQIEKPKPTDFEGLCKAIADTSQEKFTKEWAFENYSFTPEQSEKINKL